MRTDTKAIFIIIKKSAIEKFLNRTLELSDYYFY